MSALIVIAIVLVVLFAIATVLATVRRREMGQAVGQLSRETAQRDSKRRKGEVASGTEPAVASGKEIERAVVAARSGTAVVSATSTAPTLWVPPDPETYAVTRRQFLNRSIVQMMGLAITTFAAASFTAFLWPTGSSGFGGLIRIGKISDIKGDIAKNSGFLYKPEGRMWVTQFPPAALPKARLAYKGQACLPGMEAGIVALYQKCVHLGCRVPACLTSQWFECPCHGSQYSRVGEKKGGPAPRGLDRFPVAVAPDGTVSVDTASSKIILGPPIGTNTTGQEAEGPHCVG